IGLNTGMQAALAGGIDQPWCDLGELLGEKIDRNKLIAAILGHLIPALQGFPHFDSRAFRGEWSAWDMLQGRTVRVDTGQGVVQGMACGLDDDGQLVVQLTNGRRQAFSSADVSAAPAAD
ncbi:MAG: biotin--[acetyl-CoA-carboxylase] ligase, partial [Thiolinea sp.]